MIHTRRYLEEKYKRPDPWGYQTAPYDARRKAEVIRVASIVGPAQTLLDVGCGEGWITKDIPADVAYGFELSENARARIPEPVIPLASVPLDLRADLVVVTGVLYSHYDLDQILKTIRLAATRYVLTCHTAEHEERYPHAQELFSEQFPYSPGKTQTLRLFHV